MDRTVGGARDGHGHAVNSPGERVLEGRGSVRVGRQNDFRRREQLRVDRTVAPGEQHVRESGDVASLHARPPDQRLVLRPGERHVQQPEVLPARLVVGAHLARLGVGCRRPAFAIRDVERAQSGVRVLEHYFVRDGQAVAP